MKEIKRVPFFMKHRVVRASAVKCQFNHCIYCKRRLDKLLIHRAELMPPTQPSEWLSNSSALRYLRQSELKTSAENCENFSITRYGAFGTFCQRCEPGQNNVSHFWCTGHWLCILAEPLCLRGDNIDRPIEHSDLYDGLGCGVTDAI